MAYKNLIRVAVARDPRQALPLSGTFEGSATDALGMTVSVETREIKAGEENPLRWTAVATSGITGHSTRIPAY
jgi:hypothetical protein